MIELLPCPFCGSKAIAYFDQQDNIATCTNEDCPAMPGSVGNKTLQEARDKWNTRTARPEGLANDAADAARYRYLKDNRRLLNITIEAFYPGKRTVNGKEADGLIDWYMKEYPVHADETLRSPLAKHEEKP